MHNVQSLSDRSIVDALRIQGFRATPQRIAICRFVVNSRDHPTAQRIYEEVRRQYPTVSLATVYKTISALKGLNMLQELPTFEGNTRFDSNVEAHVNLICVQCRSIRDLDGFIVKEMISKIARTSRFDVRGHSLSVYGICQECYLKKGNRGKS